MYLAGFAETQGDKAAVVHAGTGAILTYAALDRRADQLVHALRRAGLEVGDHVALLMENRLEVFEVVAACMRAGLYLTPINHHLATSEAAYIVENCDAKALVASAGLEQAQALGEASPQCPLRLAVGGPVSGFDDYEDALAAEPATPVADPRLGALMLYSSGTTGKPKGVRRSLPTTPVKAGNPNFQALVKNAGFDRDSVYLSPAPLYHSAPLGYGSAAVQTGATVVMMERFDPEAALDAIERHRVTHSQWVPTMFIRMLKLPAEVRARYDLSSQRRAMHAAAPCPMEVKREMIAWWGPIIDEYWSSTEGAGYTRISSEEWLRKPGSVGRPMGQPLHICDEEGEELPPGASGQIYAEVAGGAAFAYHKDDGKTAATAHPRHPHWRSVGDIGYLDEDGYLFLTDRKAFMIISGGVNIYPQQIENALALHPALADAAVIGAPNAELGEEVKAVVQPAEGVAPSPELAAELMAFVQARLGRQLTPRSVDFVDEMPRAPNGKLYKQALRERYWPPASPAAPAR